MKKLIAFLFVIAPIIAAFGGADARDVSNATHNGSAMRLDIIDGAVRIYYVRPRDGLGAVVRNGTLLFDGRISDGRVEGSAHTFKSGCQPAPYAVRGSLRNDTLVLHGPAPRRVRNSCAVAHLDAGSGHSELVFEVRDQQTLAALGGALAGHDPRWAAAAEHMVRSAESFAAPVQAAAPAAEIIQPPLVEPAGATVPSRSESSAEVSAEANVPLPDMPHATAPASSAVAAQPEMQALAPSVVADATPSAPETQVAEPAPPLTFEALLDTYIAQYPELREDERFALNFAQMTRCEEFRAARSDEFAIRRFRHGAQAALQARGEGVQTARLRFEARFGEYDFETSSFEFRPVHANSYRTVGKTREWNCEANHERLPSSFFVYFANPELVAGLSMTPDEAEAFLEQRRNIYTRQVDRVLVVELTVEIGEIAAPQSRREEVMMVSNYFASRVDAVITDMAIFAGSRAETPFATLDPERKRAYEERLAAERAVEEEDRRLNQNFSHELYRDQMNRILAGEDLRAERRTRSAAGLGMTATGEDWRHTALYPDMPVESAGNASLLRFVNADAAADLAIPASVREAAGRLVNLQASTFYVPVGAIDDQETGQSVLLVHLVGLEYVVTTEAGTFRETVSVGGEPQLRGGVVDTRAAEAFSVLGISVRDTPSSVRSSLETAFGDPLHFDENLSLLRTAHATCGYEGPVVAQATGPVDRCIWARFAPVRRGFFGGLSAGLVELTVRQNFRPDEIDDFVNVMTGEYGPPRAVASSDRGHVMVWGAKLGPRRTRAVSTTLGTHALEVELLDVRDGIQSHFRLTDPAFDQRPGG
jgi:hypothetical protein